MSLIPKPHIKASQNHFEKTAKKQILQTENSSNDENKRSCENTDFKLKDKTPRYTVQQVSEILNMSPHTIRYYDDCGLIPSLLRTSNNIRLFSEFDLGWLKIAHALRFTGLSIAEVKHYVNLCLIGDSTIPERAKIVFAQEKVLNDRLQEMREQFRFLCYKKEYYQKLLNDSGQIDTCNPARD